MSSERSRYPVCRTTSRSTAWASAQLAVSSTAEASLSCSAWLSRSAATYFGSAGLSAMASTSEGPATMSMSRLP